MLYNISLSKKVILDSEIFVKQLKVPKCFEVSQLSILRIYELILGGRHNIVLGFCPCCTQLGGSTSGAKLKSEMLVSDMGCSPFH